MNIITAKEAKIRFGRLLNNVQREPVTITKNGNPIAVMMGLDSPELLQAVEEVIEDHYWGYKAIQADSDGYFTAEKSKALLDECLNA